MKKTILFTAISLILLPLESMIYATTKPLVQIPFNTNGYQTYLEVEVNGSGEKLCFAFDTGAGSTVLDRNYLGSSNITLTGEKEEMSTSTNVVQVDISQNNRVNLNGFEISNIKFYIESLAHLTPAPNGQKVAGVIGFDLLKNYVTYINHEKNYIELYPKGTELYPNAATLPFYLFEGQLPAFQAILQTESGKKLPVRLVFDSGASFTMSLASNFIAKHNMDSELKVKVKVPVIGGAQSSSSVNYLSSMKQISFGGFTFDHVAVNFSTASTGAMATDSVDGVIGFDLIKRFNVVMDYDHKTIKLIPNNKYNSPFEFNLTGLSFRTKNNEIVVVGVMDYSPAKNAGIKEGDVVISVDNKKFKSSAELRNYLKASYKTKTFTVQRASQQLDIVVKPAIFY
ncbi:MAG: aspartyl protease family protein [Paludibacter sp.]